MLDSKAHIKSTEDVVLESASDDELRIFKQLVVNVAKCVGYSWDGNMWNYVPNREQGGKWILFTGGKLCPIVVLDFSKGATVGVRDVRRVPLNAMDTIGVVLARIADILQAPPRPSPFRIRIGVDQISD